LEHLIRQLQSTYECVYIADGSIDRRSSE